MKQIVLNGCYGCFGLSECAIELYRELGGNKITRYGFDRCDPILIEVIKRLGEEADGDYAALYVEELDERYDYHITDYDGYERLKTSVNENVLRNLIKEGDEDKIVEYVMGAQA